MPFELTNTGLSIQTFQEVYDEIADGYRAAYGSDIDLSPNTPDGQRVGIEAKAAHDLQVFAQDLYSSFDPDLAGFDALNRVIKLAGITRRPATRSTWDVTVTTDRALTLETGYTIKDSIGQNWILTAPVSVSAGSTVVTFRSETFGAITGTAGDTLEQDTIVLGVTALAAPSDATVGIEEETDAELRLRRSKSLQNASYSTVGGLFAKLANLPGVTDLAVYENDQKTDDPVTGITANTVWAVVEGGAASEIVEAITKNKTAGCNTKGAVSGVFSETVIRPDGSEFIITHTMRFDRPTEVPVYVKVNATRKQSGVPIDPALIAQRIAAEAFNIGDNLVASQLYAGGYQAGSGFILTDLLVSDDNVTFTDERLVSALDGKFTLDPANVTVTEIIP